MTLAERLDALIEDWPKSLRSWKYHIWEEARLIRYECWTDDWLELALDVIEAYLFEAHQRPDTFLGAQYKDQVMEIRVRRGLGANPSGVWDDTHNR